ncbi:flavodoxin domain-containing protein [Secundilactobacillus folii]|uniref:Flavodoxin n=1 Tax=Secundilactobacillus folii TaxID=2678357 RepID=A0A7X2XVA6_9LACO|nr:flavodoxin domain-containing protein [Secundilactobacillus folii]MTV82190.1 flavodoxin [Secundilactobacillus folii]
MPTAAVIYASLTGNNEEIAEYLVTQLRQLNVDAQQIEMSTCKVTTLQQVNLAVIVPYTYGEGDLPEEGLDLFDELGQLQLPHLIFGVAGSGDEWYGENYCRAVTQFDQRLQTTGATQGAIPLFIDLRMTEDDQKRLRTFARKLVATYEGS